MSNPIKKILTRSGVLLVTIAAIVTGCDKREKEHLTLKFDSPAEFFEEALVLGNGHLGATVYGGTDEDRISLNDITLWTGEPDKGDSHYDISQGIGDEASETIPLIREALDREDYAEAERLNKKVQGHFSESYQPLGSLRIRYPDGGTIDGYSRVLDISEAKAEVRYNRDGVPFRTEYFVSAPDSVIVIRFESASPLSAEISLDTPLPHIGGSHGDSIDAEGYAAYHSYPGYYKTGEGQLLFDPSRGIHFMTVVKVKEHDGALTAENGILSLKDCRSATIIVANSTSFNGPDKDPVTEGKPYRGLVRDIIEKASAKPYAQILSDHIRDYRHYFDRMDIFLGKTADSIKALPTDVQLRRYTDLGEDNPELEALYCQWGRYLLISSSRTKGVPANLQGLWNESMDPPWSSNYTININLEENYWPAEIAALPEMHDVLISFLDGLSRNGKKAAEKYYGILQGWNAGHNSDIWAMATPVGLESGDPSWACWTMGGAWLSTHIWEKYLFSSNVDELKGVYPILKGAAEFCIDWLVEKNGELITSPSTSPENIYITDEGFRGATLYGATADLAISRECIADAVKAAKVLGDDPEFIRKGEEALSRMRPYKVGKDGNLQEWYHDWKDAEPTHRHQSHLIGLYPGHQITPESTPDLAKAAARTLEIKGDNTTGWSTGWRVNLFSRLHDGEGAYRMLRRLLRYVSPDGYSGKDAVHGGGTYPNLLDAHSPFQIDGNFGGCAGILEMIIQSDEDGTVHPLSAVPGKWKEGYVKGVRVRGGKIVDIEWKNGKVTSLKEKPAK